MHIVVPIRLVPDLVEELTIEASGSALDTTWLRLMMGKAIAMGGLVIVFSGSTIVGSIIGLMALKLLERAGFAELKKE